MTQRNPIACLAVLGSAAVLLTGCAGSRIDSLLGRGPIASGALYRQAETVVLARDREAFPGCNERRVVETALLEAPEVVAGPQEGRESVSFSGAGTPNSYVVPPESRYSLFVERWTVQRCGTNASYRVTFRPTRDQMRVDAVPESVSPTVTNPTTAP